MGIELIFLTSDSGEDEASSSEVHSSALFVIGDNKFRGDLRVSRA
jgi:hypothetical protein